MYSQRSQLFFVRSFGFKHVKGTQSSVPVQVLPVHFCNEQSSTPPYKTPFSVSLVIPSPSSFALGVTSRMDMIMYINYHIVAWPK